MEVFKRYKKIVALIIILLSVLFIYSFKSVYGATLEGITGLTYKYKLFGREYYNITVDFFYKNTKAFCIQQNKKFRTGTYGLYGPYHIDGETSNYANALAYILWCGGSTTSVAVPSFGDYDNTQRALWNFLDDHHSDISSLCDGYLNISQGGYYRAIAEGATVSQATIDAILGGDDEWIYYADIYVFKSSTNQRAIWVSATDRKQNIHPFEITFNKEDKNHDPVKGAKITVEAVSGVKEIMSPNPATATSNESGYFDKFKIKPEHDNSTSVIKVTETPPKGYLAPATEYTITITHSHTSRRSSIKSYGN